MTNKLTDDLISLIFNTGQILKEKVRAKSNFKDCSFLHVQTIHYIKDHDQISMKEVADFLHITPPSATSLINSLVKDKLVERIINKNDRRTIKLIVTDKGAKLLKNKFERMAKITEKYINKLTAQEKKNFIVILNKISK